MGGMIRRIFGAVVTVISVASLNSRAIADTLYVAIQNGANNGSIDKITTGGGVSTFVTGLNNPSGLAFGSGGMLYVSVAPTAGTVVVDKVSPSGVVSPFTSTIVGDYLHGSAFDTLGNLYVGLDGSGLTKVTPAGSNSAFGSALGQNVAFDSKGNLFSAATVAGELYETSPGGASQVFGTSSSPIGLAFDHSGDLFVSDEDPATINDYTASGGSLSVSPLAYASFAGSVSPFPVGASVEFYGLAFDSHGTLYVAESDGTDGAIGIVTSGGTIQTYATFAGVPTFIADPSVSPVPEPVSMSMLALGGMGLLGRRRRGS